MKALSGLLALIVSSHAFADQYVIPCKQLSDPELNKLDRTYQRDGIRVFYTLDAPQSGADHQLPPQSRTDANNNGVPDFIENIATQAIIARQTYNLLGFRDPQESTRYKVLQYIDINLLNIEGNGLAYNKPVFYPAAPQRGNSCTLRMDISINLEQAAPFTTNWMVVAHEMFHLFQYGATQIIRPWVNEPTAKWAEYALRSRPGYPTGTPGYTLPDNFERFRAEVIDDPVSVSASRFWSRLTELIDTSSDMLRVPDSLLEQRYIDGQPVFKDATLSGAAFVTRFYQGLDAEDKLISSLRGWNPYDWPSADQRSELNDAVIFSALQRTIRQMRITNAELDGFLSIDFPLP